MKSESKKKPHLVFMRDRWTIDDRKPWTKRWTAAFQWCCVRNQSHRGILRP